MELLKSSGNPITFTRAEQLYFSQRKSALAKNKTVTVVDDDKIEESVDVGLVIWNILISWIFGESEETETEMPPVETEPQFDGMTDDIVNDHESDFDLWGHVYEEQHLDLFYIISTLFLGFLIFHIVKKNMLLSRRRAELLVTLQKLKLDRNSENTGVMRQISFH